MSLPIQNQIKCPACSQSDQTILIEDLYFGLIEKDQKAVARFSIQPDQIKPLLQDIKPPTLEKLPIWLIIPPDIFIGIIIGIILLLVVISGMQQGFDQKYAFPMVLLLVYLIFRRYLNAQYIAKKTKGKKKSTRLKKQPIDGLLYLSVFMI